MNFQEAEKSYQDLRTQYSAGKLSNTDFETEVSKLKVQDPDGRWWQIGVQSGEWYVHDGQKWTKSRPPTHGSAPVVPAASPETPPATSPPPATVAAAGTGAVAAAAVAAAPPPPKTSSKGLTPRFFSAAPARGGGGLPTPVLAGIIGVVALIGIAILAAAYMLVSGQFKGSGTPTTVAKATAALPTVAVILPSPALPTLPPPPPATNTPIALPTVAVPVTPTTSIATTTAITSSRPITATATRRPAGTGTPAGTAVAAAVTATRTPALPPGVYVSKVRTDPAKPIIGEPMTFYVTFLNNTNSVGPGTWLVKLFKCNSDCTGEELADNKSIGETPKSTKQILPGTTEVSIGPWTVGLGACNYVATPYYIDGLGNVVPFPVAGGPRMFYNFKMCQ